MSEIMQNSTVNKIATQMNNENGVYTYIQKRTFLLGKLSEFFRVGICVQRLQSQPPIFHINPYINTDTAVPSIWQLFFNI